jgi:hypothetical protein
VIDPSWRRIAGLHILDDGMAAAVWIAHDRDSDTLHLYDAALFQREVLAVIAEGLNARGRWIPVAWPKDAKEVSDKLLDRGCNMLPEHSDDSDAMTEANSLDIQERMRTSRFKVDKRLQNWLDEFRTFFRADAKVPKTSHPLMSATRHAIAMLPYARRQAPRGRKQVNYPRVSIL